MKKSSQFSHSSRDPRTCACTSIRHCVRVCLYPRRSSGCRCRWGIGGEDRIGRREAGWTSLARLRRRAKGGEERSAAVRRSHGEAMIRSAGRTERAGRASRSKKGATFDGARPALGETAPTHFQQDPRSRLELVWPWDISLPPSLPPFPPGSPRSSSAVSESVLRALVLGTLRGVVSKAADGRPVVSLPPSSSFPIGEPIARRTSNEWSLNEFSEAVDCSRLLCRTRESRDIDYLSRTRRLNFGFLVLRYIEGPKGFQYKGTDTSCLLRSNTLNRYLKILQIFDFVQILNYIIFLSRRESLL